MDEYKFNSAGSDKTYLANANLFFTALYNLAIFKSMWPEEKLGSQSVLQKAFDWFRESFEGALTGNRVQIAARKTARQDLDLRIQKILHYLAVMAEESDITLLLNTGVVMTKSRKKARRSAKPAPAPAA